MKWRFKYFKHRIKQILGKKKWVINQYNDLIKQSKSCKNTWYNRLDCLCAYMMFGAEAEDYFAGLFFEHRNPFYRNQCVTRKRLIFIKKLLNSSSALETLNSKEKFNILYKDYIGRKWCNISEIEENDFVEKLSSEQGYVIVKPEDGFGGRGVFKSSADETNLRKLFKELREDGKKYIVEEYINQTGFLHDVNPSSLNTVRLITGRCRNEIIPMHSYFRAGGANSVVDNLHSDGVCYPIDYKTGEIYGGITWKEGSIEVHPSTGIKVAGYKIPRWNEVIEFAMKLHRMAPEGANLIGWDLCITEDRILVIEGNGGPGFIPEMGYNTWKMARNLMNNL